MNMNIQGYIVKIASHAGGELASEDMVAAQEYNQVVQGLFQVVQGYLIDARGEVEDEFTTETPFMDAGLDSLDMLKVNLGERPSVLAIKQEQS